MANTLTIVTVTRNPSPDILLTAYSVLTTLQECRSSVYWHIQDNSDDQACIKLFDNLCLHNHDRITISHMPDTSIYDAMNKSLSFVSTSHVLYLNSGDLVHPEGVRAFLAFKFSPNRNYVFSSYKITRKHLIHHSKHWPSFHSLKILLSKLYMHLPASHNSIVFSLANLRDYPYSTVYSCAADFHQFIRMKRAGLSFSTCISTLISSNMADGYISKRHHESYSQYIQILSSYGFYYAAIYWRLRSFLLFQRTAR